MIYLFVALYQEAKELIRQLHLKKKETEIPFDVFEGDSFRLVLTGIGPLAAASAVSSCLTHFKISKRDFAVNFGSCASEKREEGVYRCCQIMDRAGGRVYYPDMLLRSPLPVAGIITQSRKWELSQEQEKTVGFVLHDMEAAAVYAAGSYFLSPHQMHFIKAVTDFGEKEISGSLFSERILKAVPKVLSYLEILNRMQPQDSEHGKPVIEEDLERIFGEFQCSQTMKASLKQSLWYWTLTGRDYQKKLQAMRETGELPCKNRREGKESFEKLRREFL